MHVHDWFRRRQSPGVHQQRVRRHHDVRLQLHGHGHRGDVWAAQPLARRYEGRLEARGRYLERRSANAWRLIRSYVRSEVFWGRQQRF